MQQKTQGTVKCLAFAGIVGSRAGVGGFAHGQASPSPGLAPGMRVRISAKRHRPFAVELRVKLAIGGNQRGGAANDKGDLVIGVPLVGEDNYTCECSYVVLNGAESVIQSASDFFASRPWR